MTIRKFLKYELKKGQLLVEVLIGLGIMTILISAIIPLMITSANSFILDKKNETAVLLAQEQISAVRAIKEEDWNKIYEIDKDVAYHAEVSGPSWVLTQDAKVEEIDGVEYTKSITINNVSRTVSNGAGEIVTDQYLEDYDDPSTQKVVAEVTGFGGAPVTVVEYLTRWENQIHTETDWSGGQYSSVNRIDTTSVPGALELSKTGGGTGEYGNKFFITSVGRVGRLNSTTTRDAMRFTAQKTGQVNQIRVYLDNATNSGAINYRLGIQADNGGLPSGAYLSSQIAAFSSAGWHTINLPVIANLTGGAIYHIVIQYDSGTAPSGNRYIDIRNSDPQNNLVPLTQAVDLNQNTMFYRGSWTIENRQPIYVLGFNDGTFEGNPYDISEARRIFAGNYEGELFTIPSDTTISALNLHISKNANQNPAAALRVVLRDLTTNTDIVDDSSITGAALTTAYAWKTININPNKNLTAGHQYRLYLSSQGSASNRHYRIYAESNPDTADYNSINWDGINSVTSRSANGGGSFTESNFIDMTGYNFTTVLNQSYESSGDLTSQTIDLGKTVGLNRVSWTHPVLPGTTIKVQIAANNDNASWIFSGPDGLATSYYTISGGENIYFKHSNNQFVRYKVFLETSLPQSTPTLEEIKINYSP